MALTTQDALELSIKQVRSVLDIMESYASYDHQISRQERDTLHELVGTLTEAKDLTINTVRGIAEERWEG